MGVRAGAASPMQTEKLLSDKTSRLCEGQFFVKEAVWMCLLAHMKGGLRHQIVLLLAIDQSKPWPASWLRIKISVVPWWSKSLET